MRIPNAVIQALVLIGGVSTVGAAAAARTPGPQVPCAKPAVRREWRTLSLEERHAYIAAIKCLQAAPGQTGDTYAGVRSRYDDFLALHIAQADYIHWVGHFLPWHRYFLWLFERALRETCDFAGAVPYWDWTLDAVPGDNTTFPASPVFDAVGGFGGNGPWIADLSGFPADALSIFPVPGRSGGGCITDGPFADYRISMGPGNHTEYTPHCIRRDFSPWLAGFSIDRARYDEVLAAEDFWEFEHRTEGVSLEIPDMSLHGGGHLSVGGEAGEMSNTYSSPGDPLFWLHHGGIDRAWDEWQRRDFDKRKVDIDGPDTQWAYPWNYFGDKPYRNVTLASPLNLGRIGGVVDIAYTMDTRGGLFCYTYA